MFHPDEYWHPILSRPHDDEPRLRYAGWLQRRGEPLGEFIHLQCQLARLPDEGADHAFGSQSRQHELIEQHGECWSAALRHHVAWCAFRRGFVEEVALSSCQLAGQAESLFRHAPLTDLHLVPGGVGFEELPHVPSLERTVFLDVSGHSLRDDGLARLARAPFLEHVHGLNLSSCELGDGALQALGDSPYVSHLRELYLCDNAIGDEGIRRLVLTPLIDRLDVLYVRLNPISGEAIGLLGKLLGGSVHC